ncbi:MAG: BrnT family toxin [Ahrensia sp.]|nr:BrnT family toxin [Ahrensia sp.]
MQFEYDLTKSASNFEKHGIDFETAQRIWDDPWMLEIEAKTTAEKRFLSVGEIDGRRWTAVWTYRFRAIRIISVRRSRKKEIERYESVGF